MSASNLSMSVRIQKRLPFTPCECRSIASLADRGRVVPKSTTTPAAKARRKNPAAPKRPAGAVAPTSAAALAALPDDELMEIVQRQTFKFFWEGAHPVSGLTLDRCKVRANPPNDKA